MYSQSVFADDQFLGTAFVNPRSNIFARIFTRDEITQMDEKFFAQKFELAEKSTTIHYLLINILDYPQLFIFHFLSIFFFSIERQRFFGLLKGLDSSHRLINGEV